MTLYLMGFDRTAHVPLNANVILNVSPETVKVPSPLMTPIVLFAVLVPGITFAAVPVVNNITDSAGYGPRVAPGSLASLFGSGLATAATSASGFPLATSLDGTTVSVAGTLAPLLYVSPAQINFQVP